MGTRAVVVDVALADVVVNVDDVASDVASIVVEDGIMYTICFLVLHLHLFHNGSGTTMSNRSFNYYLLRI